ncbi:E3 ubiquitin-protein ligase Topors-like [Heliangelus exortis]|uniref:E3 ubiquitin-protein ligase Topors-like n=1 Tax=Heliangelus exortis TaxID=472823 RepID=UPI003A8CC711
MADESQWCCPICYSHEEGIASLSPCRHQFCLGCAMRWTQQNRRCPLCRAESTTIIFSQRSDDDYFSIDITDPTGLWAVQHQEEQGAEEPMRRAQTGGFPPEVWAEFFKRNPNNIWYLQVWIQGELETIFEGEWWEEIELEGTIIFYLCLYGLDEEQLLQDLQVWLGNSTQTFVHELIEMALHLCGRDLRQYLAQQNAADSSSTTSSSDTCLITSSSPSTTTSPNSCSSPTISPAASPSHTASQRDIPDSISSPAGPDMEEHPSTSEPIRVWGGPSSPPSVPVPVDQEEPQEEPGVAVPGPSAQGCSHSPSTPSQGRDRSPRGPRRPPKRRAPSPQDSPQPRRRC